MVRKAKTEYYSNLDQRTVTDNKLVWNTISLFFSYKGVRSQRINLIEQNKTIGSDVEISLILTLFVMGVGGGGRREVKSNPTPRPREKLVLHVFLKFQTNSFMRYWIIAILSTVTQRKCKKEAKYAKIIVQFFFFNKISSCDLFFIKFYQ